MGVAPRFPCDVGKDLQKLKESTLSVSGGNGTAKTESYTFQSDCVFCAVIAQVNPWSDKSLAKITASSGITEQSTITLGPTFTQAIGGATVIMTGKAQKGAVITFLGVLRIDGTGTATFPYAVFSF